MSAIYTGSSSGTPTGAAGGDLAGTYPNPTVSSLANATLAWSNYTPTWTGFSVAPANVPRFAQLGKVVFVEFQAGAGANGTSNASTFTVTLPTTAKGVQIVNFRYAFDNGSVQSFCCGITSDGSNVLTLANDTAFSESAWTSSGSKGITGNIVYEAA